MSRAFFFRLGAVVVGLAVAIVTLELGLRLFRPEEISLLLADERLGQRYRRSFEQERYIPESGRRIRLRFNRLGFRGADRTEAAPPGTRRIAVHGDSLIAATAVAEEETMVARLERGLNAASSSAWEVLNFGVSGYSTAQSLLAWREVSSAFEPDLVIVVFLVSNDVADNSHEVSSSTRPYARVDAAGELSIDPESGVRFGSSRWLREHTLVYPWHKLVLRRARLAYRKRAGVLSAGLQSMNAHPSAELERAWEMTFRLLERFCDEVEAAGSSFLLAIAPDPGQYDDDVWTAMLGLLSESELPSFDRDYPQRRLARFAAEREIAYLDLLPGFRDGRAGSVLSFGRGHWNVAGNALAAELIQRRLEGEL